MQWTDRIGRRLRPRDLHVFLAVLEERSMAKAAERLAISRPVVSKTIAHLEQTLGVRLFDRNSQGLEPTLYGRTLLKRSIAVFDELRLTVQELEFLSDPNSGEVRFGCTETMAAGVIPAVIDNLSRRYPRLTFRYQLESSDTLLHQLRERKFEFCLAWMQASVPDPDMDAEALLHEPIFVVTGKSNRLARRRKIALTELANEPWILAPLELAANSPLVEAFQREGLPMPRGIALGVSIPLRNILLATGRFLTIMSASMLEFGPQRSLLKILPVAIPRWRLPVAIFTMRNRTLSPAAHLFIAAVRDLACRLQK